MTAEANRKCRICGGSLRSDNTLDVCMRTADCKREHDKLYQRNKQDECDPRKACAFPSCRNLTRHRNADACQDHSNLCVRHWLPRHGTGSTCVECDRERSPGRYPRNPCRVSECNSLASGPGGSVFCAEHSNLCTTCTREARAYGGNECAACQRAHLREWTENNREYVREKHFEWRTLTVLGATRHDREKLTREEGSELVAAVEAELEAMQCAN